MIQSKEKVAPDVKRGLRPTRFGRLARQSTICKAAAQAGCTFGVLLALAGAANAADIAWDGGGDGISYNDPLNWSTDTVPGSADVAIFASTDIGDVSVNIDAQVLGVSFTDVGWNVSAVAGRTLSVGGTVTTGGIVSSSSNGGTNTLSGSLRFTGTSGSQGGAISVAANNTLALNTRAVNGSTLRTINGPGTVLFGGRGILGNGTTLTSGTLRVTASGGTVAGNPIGGATVGSATGVGAGTFGTTPATVASGQVDTITLTNGGSGYTNPPAVRVSSPTGTGAVQATAIGLLPIEQALVTTSGSGYNQASPPAVTLTNPAATFTANRITTTGTTQNTIGSVTVGNPGAGYAANTNYTFTSTNGGGTTAATFTAMTNANGQFTRGAIVTNAGAGFTGNATTFSTTGPAQVTTNATFAATAVVNAAGQVTGVNITNNGGIGFLSAPSLNIAAPASGGTQAVVTTLTGGPLTSIAILVRGALYSSAPRVLISQPNTGSASLGSDFAVSGGTYDINGFSVQARNISGAGTVTNTSGTTASFTSELTTTTAIATAFTGSLSLILAQTGNSTMQLTNAANSYSGGTIVRQGTLRIGTDVPATGNSVLGNGGTIRLGDVGSIFNNRIVLAINYTPTTSLQNVTVTRPIDATEQMFPNLDGNNARIRVGVDAASITGTFAGTIVGGVRRLELIATGDGVNGFLAPSATGGDGLASFTGAIVENTAGAATITINGGNAGTGAIRLSGASSFTSSTNISNGTLLIGANVGASGSSPLGTSGSVTVSDGASPATFVISILTDGAFSVNRSFNQSGAGTNTTSFTTVFGSTAAGASSFGSITSATDTRIKNLQLSTPTGATVSYGIIGANADATGVVNVAKLGGGIASLTGDNTYDGTTTLSAGTLQLASANRLPDATALTAADATTINTGGFSDTLGSLTLPNTGNVTLDLGNGSSVVRFAPAAGAPLSDAGTGGTGTLQVLNYNGNAGSGDALFFVTPSGGTAPTADQLGRIQFIDPAGATAGTYTGVLLASGEVVPDIPITLSFASTTASVLEGNFGSSPLSFTVGLSRRTDGSVTVDYATADGTAVSTGSSSTGGGDFTSTSGTLTIASGSNTGTFSVPISGDTVSEGNETFTIDLSNATGGAPAATIGANASTTVTIQNDDRAPTLSVSSVAVNEGNTGTSTLQFRVRLTAPSSQDITVNYATTDGTATAGSDYTALDSSNGTGGATAFVIPAGSTTAIIGVSVIGDTTTEADETFTLTLSGLSPTGAAAFPGGATTTSATGTITNDDADATPAAATVAGVSVLKSGLVRNRSTGRYIQTIFVRNDSGAEVTGPIYLALDNLANTLQLFNAAGTTTRTTPQGSPYVVVTPNTLAAGTGVTLTLEFVNPTNTFISFTPRILQGPGTP